MGRCSGGIAACIFGLYQGLKTTTNELGAYRRTMISCYVGRELPNIEILSPEERKTILAKLSKGLAHPARVEILIILAHRTPHERCICGDIVNALPLAQSSVSQHLKVLKETGWIQGTIDGPRVCYCLIDGIINFYEALIMRSLKEEEAIVDRKETTEDKQVNV